MPGSDGGWECNSAALKLNVHILGWMSAQDLLEPWALGNGSEMPHGCVKSDGG